ncbi:MAG: winged helix-turn-helix transcriptional regulator [candidate division Zixibacteria bacterium]|nr:winged helix-turn-helix transcriptional regulator [candidate division Zixibacteria bacterium]
MKPKEKAQYEIRAKIVKAMAHPTRLYIVDQLAKNDLCVNELTEKIGDDMSTVSKHLSVLKSVGIVQSKKKGTQVYYHLKMPCMLNFFGCVESVIKSTANEQLKLIR